MAEITKTLAPIGAEADHTDIKDIEGEGVEVQGPAASLSQAGIVSSVVEPLTVGGAITGNDELPRPFSAASAESSGGAFIFPTAADAIKGITNTETADTTNALAQGLQEAA